MANILVVDDEKLVLEILEARLQPAGHQVDTCENGDVALKKALNTPYDLIIVDYNMPNMTGDALCQKLRQAGQGVPVIIMTALVQLEPHFFIGCGATEVIYKPFNRDELLELVLRHLAP